MQTTNQTLDGGPAKPVLDDLRETIEHAAHLLPAQGPITVFIHHNTLHAFEDFTFEEAVRRGAETFDCEPYLGIGRYREELQRGRIRVEDLRAVLQDDLKERAGDSLLGLATRLELRLAMLQQLLDAGSEVELQYYLAETDALRTVRPDVSATVRTRLVAETRRWIMRDFRSSPEWVGDLLRPLGVKRIEQWDESTWEALAVSSLWHICRAGVEGLSGQGESNRSAIRHRDLVLAATGTDADLAVNDLLVRFCASFLDQGVSHWTLPRREEGLFRAFLHLYAQSGGPPDSWLQTLPAMAAGVLQSKVSPIESIGDSLAELGVPSEEWDDYLSATILALRGWAGMIRQVEQRGDSVSHSVPPGSLIEFVAVRLILDRLAAEHVAKTNLRFNGPLAALRERLRAQLPGQTAPSPDGRAFALFQLAQIIGWSANELLRLTPLEIAFLVGEIEDFSELDRRRIFHLAYERRFRTQSLDALALHERFDDLKDRRPRFQAITCLDEREESFRRHLEEVAPDAQTFGAAGFFNVVMYYRGASDAHFVPLCPIVLTPKHWVEERVGDGHVAHHERRKKTRKALGRATHGFHRGTRSFATGAVLTAGLGVLASVPLVARVLFPRLAAKVRNHFGRYVRTPAATQLKLERRNPTPGDENGSLGFSVEEMATAAERLLRDIGLVQNFARLVFVLGHGSDSVNNPHKSAYDCGACGGSPGAPNGRALAHMLNDPRIRERIAANGSAIPDDTRFVGGYHNTCDDSVTLADVDGVPETHRVELERVVKDFANACVRNAHERSRRFMSAPLDQLPADARKHVENRSEDLAQVRPELGHATNALCIVGRRERTRGLFLDRRAFLTSYDPTQDDAIGSTLARLLGAAVPVCSGINLEYYFSHVDSRGYGCGTKLPHNVTALLGVMDGASSDLRTGLPWQMVEIHEPVRLLFVVETTPEVLLAVMGRNPTVDAIVRNGWVQMAVLDPATHAIRVFDRGEFVLYEPASNLLPVARSSIDWYRGWRGHLEFAEIQTGA